MRALTISALRGSIKEQFDYVIKSMGVIVVPRSKGKDSDGVVIISLKEYNSLKETEHLLSTKANRNRLREGLVQIESEETVQYKLD